MNVKKGLRQGLVGLLAGTMMIPFFVAGSGCNHAIIGGYQHKDMSNSPNASKMMEKADELASTGNLKDTKTAAELYGTLGKIDGALDKMGECVLDFFGKKPDYEGQLLLERQKKIHNFYRK